MKISFIPKSKVGKWSIGLTLLLVLNLLAFFICMALYHITFNEIDNYTGSVEIFTHWWDITLISGFLIEFAAFILSIIAVVKKDKAVLVWISLVIGSCAILFLFLHGLFIQD